MTGGIRSRRLANTISSVARSEVSISSDGLREWLASQSIDDWRNTFTASATELADLLAYVRSPAAHAISELLEGSELELQLEASSAVTVGAAATLTPDSSAPHPAPILVTTDTGTIGRIRTADHDDVTLLLSIGLPLSIRLDQRETSSVAIITIAPEQSAE
jgi:hypothetical protein